MNDKPSTGKNYVLPGRRFGKLIVIAREGGTGRHPKFRVQCDCGSPEYISSCGTLYKNRNGGCRACAKMGQPLKYGTPAANIDLYRTWVGMRRRCRPVADARNKHWAGRGIAVHPEWDKSFEAFRLWAEANGYKPELSIDRVNVDGHYEPSNCEWVTRSENSKRCRSMYVTVRRDGVPLKAVDAIALAIFNGVML